MRILVLAWEFPPRIVGGIARHVAELYPELVPLGCEIQLVTVEFGDAPAYEVVDGLAIHRVPVAASDNFFHWVVNMNASMGDRAGKLLHECGPFDLIHAHDWLVADAAIALKHLFKLPLVATIHATEFGRYNGLHTDTHRYIHAKEAALAHEAWRIVVCSHYMHQELQRAFQSPADKIDVIFNGIRAAKKVLPANFDRQQFRRRFAADSEQIVYYLGRMGYEKGVSVLLNAAPQVLAGCDGRVKFAVVGGGNTDAFQQQAWNLGIWHRCNFTGFMPEAELDLFQAVADCAVFPSLYEPFGIVALESFAARVPVVVSDTGGLPEVVRHGKTGIVTQTNNPDSLAWGILEVLSNPEYARSLAERAYADLSQRFDWRSLAAETQAVYQRIAAERARVAWG